MEAEAVQSGFWYWLNGLGDGVILLGLFAFVFGGAFLTGIVAIIANTWFQFQKMRIVHAERLARINAGEQVEDAETAYKSFSAYSNATAKKRPKPC